MLRFAMGVLAAAAICAGCGDEDGEGGSTAPSTGQPATALEVSSGEPDPLSPGVYTSRTFIPTPTFAVNEGWASSIVDTQVIALVRDLTSDTDCLCLIAPDAVFDPATGQSMDLPADLTEWFAANPGLDTSNPSSLQVGNRAARQMEVMVAEGAALVAGRLPLLGAADYVYSLAPGEKGHIIVIDHPDGPLVLGMRAPADTYSDFFRQTEGVVGSMTFAD